MYINAKEARQHAGLTQRDAAKLLGCSNVHLSNVETGTTGASFAFLERMGKVYKCEVSIIFDFRTGGT